MTLRPSRVVEQQQRNPLFVQKTAKKGKGRGYHAPHYGRPGKRGGSLPRTVTPTKKKSLAALARWGYAKARPLTPEQSGVEISQLVEFEDGTKALHKLNKIGSAKSELMAYEFSESIGWGIVPETILSPHEGESKVSLQRWIEGAKAVREIPGVGIIKPDRMIVMDALLGNPDRHAGNMVEDPDGRKIWAIDNNFAFGRGEGAREYKGDSNIRISNLMSKRRHGLVSAAKDVRRWSKTPACRKYIEGLSKTYSAAIAEQFAKNVVKIAKWSSE